MKHHRQHLNRRLNSNIWRDMCLPHNFKINKINSLTHIKYRPSRTEMAESNAYDAAHLKDATKNQTGNTLISFDSGVKTPHQSPGKIRSCCSIVISCVVNTSLTDKRPVRRIFSVFSTPRREHRGKFVGGASRGIRERVYNVFAGTGGQIDT
jgi:hypothetical protein